MRPKPATLFRWHRGGLAESMATVVPCASMADLLDILRVDDGVLDWSGVTADRVEVEPYGGIDHRIGWETYLVCIDGGAVGMTNGPIEGE